MTLYPRSRSQYTHTDVPKLNDMSEPYILLIIYFHENKKKINRLYYLSTGPIFFINVSVNKNTNIGPMYSDDNGPSFTKTQMYSKKLIEHLLSYLDVPFGPLVSFICFFFFSRSYFITFLRTTIYLNFNPYIM